ncbi:MICOS complex subunit MIC10 isoform X1 [Bombina bombina]|uniref:MICOS complex subunit MIC10 isoform X1 n=1 Tax=Bombina bombina TaxID=8345 RepID=UPI00235A9EF4|nr:MICOS complex subunit MIC10 isoform X1 [Bombina bombina]
MSESELGRKWDRCLADSAVKFGAGLGLGIVFSVIFFKRTVNLRTQTSPQAATGPTSGIVLHVEAAELLAGIVFTDRAVIRLQFHFVLYFLPEQL